MIVSSPALHTRPVPEVGAGGAGAVEAAAVDEAEETFLALVYTDEELLRAEFDAIIADSWNEPTPPARQRPTRPPAPPPQRRRHRSGTAGRAPGRQHYPAGEGRSRQRAPPPGRPVSPRPQDPRREGGDAAQRERSIQVTTRGPAPFHL
jgi:hypothetical protein